MCLVNYMSEMKIVDFPSRSSKKSRPLWPVMMDDRTPIYERRKLIKTYKNVLPQKRTMVAVAAKPALVMVDSLSTQR